MTDCKFLERNGKAKLAYHYTPATEAGQNLPLVFFLGGFKSDMNGTKAHFFEEQCRARGQAYLRFDYTGHGQSGGAFTDGTIGLWRRDALDMLDYIAPREVLLVGSSMGGWIALHVALARVGIVKGVIGIAAAPDFTAEMWESRLSEDQRQEILKTGQAELPNQYSDEPYILTKALFEDGKKNLLLDKEHKIEVPVSLVQGMLDPDVPWELTAKIQNAFKGTEVDIILIEDGDHSLSRPEDLDIIDREIVSLSHFKDGD